MRPSQCARKYACACANNVVLLTKLRDLLYACTRVPRHNFFLATLTILHFQWHHSQLSASGTFPTCQDPAISNTCMYVHVHVPSLRHNIFT